MRMTSTSKKYFVALNSMDREAYLTVFAADAELLDPYGGPPFHGRECLPKWFDGFEGL